jgi:hypothetical protein
MLMHIGDMLGQPKVIVSVRSVLYQPEQVESGKQCSWKLYVLLQTATGVVAPIGRVGSSQDGAPGIKCGENACFGNRDGLLLHDLVDGRTVSLSHFVKLIDTAHTLVSQHKSSTL